MKRGVSFAEERKEEEEGEVEEMAVQLWSVCEKFSDGFKYLRVGYEIRVHEPTIELFECHISEYI